MRLTRQASLVIALVCGLLAAVGAWIWISQQRAKTTKAPTTIEVPVPTQVIPAQTELKPNMFRRAAFEPGKLPSDVVTSPEMLQNQVSLIELPPEQPIRQGDIAPKSRMGLAFAVPRGYRALAVPLDIVGNVGDFVKPGNRVDVLASFERDKEVVVRTVVQDVQVLSVNQDTARAEGEKAAEGSAEGEKTTARQGGRAATTPVTLALTPAQAQVVLASEMAGKLRLALRATGDVGVAALPPANSWSLTGPWPKAEKAAAEGEKAPAPQQAPVVVNTAPTGPTTWGGPPVPPQKPRRPSVEVIRGGQREVVTPE
ncbi:MAG: Flp pilus assembly protein CpaB [Armatimonadetes bacterium]|nr:Flp pilus assembly protein CpaB [Armatimonadota bacterium]